MNSYEVGWPRLKLALKHV